MNGDELSMKCSNTYASEKNTESLTKGIGLENVQSRLDLLYPEAHQLNISTTDDLYVVDLKIRLVSKREMSITCIIVEDQPPAQRVLKKYIKDIGTLDLLGTFNDSLSALEFLKTTQVDVIFLDVHLPKLSGIDFLKIIHPKPKIILTTAFSEYALEGYELDIVDYLLKPFSFERFVKAVSKIARDAPRSNESNERKEEVAPGKDGKPQFIKSGNEYINLNIPQIQFIKSDGDYTRVITDERQHLISHPLRYWVELLPQDSFCQVHKSYIVNVRSIKKVIGNQIYIRDVEIPIGRMYKETFFSKYLEGS